MTTTQTGANGARIYKFDPALHAMVEVPAKAAPPAAPQTPEYPFYPPELHFPDWDVDIAAPESGYLLLTSSGYKVDEVVKAKPAVAAASAPATEGEALPNTVNTTHRLATALSDKATKTLLTNDSLPLVFIDSRVMMEIQYIVNRMAPITGECGGYFLSRRLDESKPHFLVHDYFLVGQDATGGEVELDGRDGAKYFEHIIANHKDKFTSKFHNLLGHWHSHGNLGAFWSSTDLKQQETYGQLGYMGDYRLFMVFNASYQIRASLVIYSPVFQRYDDIPIGIYINPQDDAPRQLKRARTKELDAQMDAQIKRKTYAPTVQWGGQQRWAGGRDWRSPYNHTPGFRWGDDYTGYDAERGYAWRTQRVIPHDPHSPGHSPSLFHGLNTEYPGQYDGFAKAYADELDRSFAGLSSDDGPATQTARATNPAAAKLETLLADPVGLKVVVAEALKRFFLSEAKDNAMLMGNGDGVPAKLPGEAYTACPVYESWYAEAGYQEDLTEVKALELANAFAEYADTSVDFNMVPTENLLRLFSVPVEMVDNTVDELLDPEIELSPLSREVMKQLLLYGPGNIDLTKHFDPDWFEFYLDA